MTTLRDPVGETWTFSSIVPPEDESEPPHAPAITVPDLPRSFLDVVYESLFGDAYSEAAQAAWRPLRLATFFTDGWNEPYIEPPAGSGGAPRVAGSTRSRELSSASWYFLFAFANEGNARGTSTWRVHDLCPPEPPV